MVVKFQCKICNKTVGSDDDAIQCDKCHPWIHMKFNKICLSACQYLQQCIYSCCCKKYQLIIYMKPMLLKKLNLRLWLQNNNNTSLIMLWMVQKLNSYQVNTLNYMNSHLYLKKNKESIFLSFEYILAFFSFARIFNIIIYLQTKIWFTWNNWMLIKNK